MDVFLTCPRNQFVLYVYVCFVYVLPVYILVNMIIGKVSVLKG